MASRGTPYGDQKTQDASGTTAATMCDREMIATLDIPPGTLLGRYIVGDEIGSGAMGTVFEAVDPDLNRRLAIKVLRMKVASASQRSVAVQRIRREAQALAQLSDPHVVTIHDIGQVEGAVFVVMDFIDGQTLRSWLTSAARTPAEILRVFSMAGRGLAAAHRAGLVHRDFKPDNVMIDERGRVFVLDFGLAHSEMSFSPLKRSTKDPSPDDSDPEASKGDAENPPPLDAAAADPDELTSPLTHAEPPQRGDAARETASDDDGISAVSTMSREYETELLGETHAYVPQDHGESDSSTLLHERFTREGTVVGTPAYMSPEQHLGSGTDARSDQFSFCVALYEALYRRLPFEAKNVRARAVKVITGELIEPSKLRGVSRRVRRALLRGLSRHPHERYESMEALLQTLQPPPSKIPKLALGGAAAVACLAIAYVSLATSSPEQRCTPDSSPLQEVWSASIADGWIDAVRQRDPTAIESTSYLRGALDRYAARWSALAERSCRKTYVDREQSEELYDLTMECLNERRTALATMVRSFQDSDDLLAMEPVDAVHTLPEFDLCEDPVALRARESNSLSDEQRTRRDALERLAARTDVLASLSRFDEATTEVRPHLPVLDDNELPPQLRAPLALSYGQLLERMGRYSDAADVLERAAILAERSGDVVRLARARIALTGLTGDRLADEKVGLLWSRLAAAALDRGGRRGTVLEAQLHASIGLVYERAERHVEAFERFRHAIDVANRVEAPAPVLAGMHGKLANALAVDRRFDDALDEADKAHALARDSVGPRSLGAISALGSRAYILDLKGDEAEAIVLLRELIDTLMAHHREDIPLLSTLRGNLGGLLARSGDVEAALEHFRFVLTQTEARLGPTHPDVASSLSNLAAALRMTGDIKGSIPHQRRAVEILEASPQYVSKLTIALSGLANSLELLGRPADAIPLRLRVIELHDASPHGSPSNFVVDLANTGHSLALIDDPRAIEFSARAVQESNSRDVTVQVRAFADIVHAHALARSVRPLLPSVRQEAAALAERACVNLPAIGAEAERRVAAYAFDHLGRRLPAACRAPLEDG